MKPDHIFGIVVAFVIGAMLVWGVVTLGLSAYTPDSEVCENDRAGTYVRGGKYGDSFCVGPDGRIVEVYN